MNDISRFIGFIDVGDGRQGPMEWVGGVTYKPNLEWASAAPMVFPRRSISDASWGDKQIGRPVSTKLLMRTKGWVGDADRRPQELKTRLMCVHT